MPRTPKVVPNPPAPNQPELPVQAAVEEPIINSPFEEPKFWWDYEKGTGKALKMTGRRAASYFWTTQRVMTGQQSLEGMESDFGSEKLELVNRLREDVARWRESDYENATQTTKKLLRHWRSADRKRRFFFCQIEAVETIIYLRELLAAGRTRRGKAGVSREEFLALQSPGEEALAKTARGEFVARLSDPPLRDDWKPLVRHGCKMATGSGKTVVMAMLTAWALCNRGAVPGDTRFPRAVLAVCPNLTVKERLQVLRPDLGAESYYEQFDIVPSQLRPLLAQGRVMITNWHAFAPESEHAESGKTYAVVNKGEEGADAFARRVLKDLYGLGEVMVLNDEAHHAYRPAPPEIAAKSKRKKGVDGFGEASKDDAEEATVWVEGLDKINQAVGVAFCADLSATPFYLAGSGWIEGSPFPWLVSDFGLVDAIESGITKIPRLPVSDTSGRPDPKFFRLWDEIKKTCEPAQMDKGKPKPDAAWLFAQPALATLGAQWQSRFEQRRDAKPGQTIVPPVMIVVCDNTDMAQLFFEKLSGETQEEVTDAGDDEAEESEKKAKTRKIRRFNSAGLPFPELANTEQRTVTLRIDSKLLAEAEAAEGGSKQDEAERLRRVVSTVGQPGQPGEHIRCVVSVQMLTEGWDANNVTQILGLRAFGSQLLCEQVVGRGLRRISYDLDPQTKMLRPEYVDVYGIPFSVIPFKGRATKEPEPDDKPVTQVKALPERAAMEIRFPNVEGYVLELKRNQVRCDLPRVERLRIQPNENPLSVFVQPQVGVREGHVGSPSFEMKEQTREDYYANHHLQTILFEIARQIVARLTDPQGEKRAPFRYQARHELFPQVLGIVQRFVDTRVDWSSADDKRELGLEIYAKQTVDRLCDAIEPDESSGEPPLLPVIDRFRPHGSTADVLFNTTRPCHFTQKSHLNQVVLDTHTWERSAAHTLEASEHVAFYARNDDGSSPDEETSHLDFGIPYEILGVAHVFYPDFLVRLANGVTLILEIKGMLGTKEEAKFQAARRWVSAVNNWGRMGRWAFHVCRDPQVLGREIAHLATTGLAKS